MYVYAGKIKKKKRERLKCTMIYMSAEYKVCLRIICKQACQILNDGFNVRMKRNHADSQVSRARVRIINILFYFVGRKSDT